MQPGKSSCTLASSWLGAIQWPSLPATPSAVGETDSRRSGVEMTVLDSTLAKFRYGHWSKFLLPVRDTRVENKAAVFEAKEQKSKPIQWRAPLKSTLVKRKTVGSSLRLEKGKQKNWLLLAIPSHVLGVSSRQVTVLVLPQLDKPSFGDKGVF